MRKYQIVMELNELRKQLDKLLIRRDREPTNDELGKEILSISEKISVREANLQSWEQQLQEGWPADQE